MTPNNGLINTDELTVMADGWMQHELPNANSAMPQKSVVQTIYPTSSDEFRTSLKVSISKLSFSFLYTHNGKKMVEYALAGLDNHLFVSTYMLQLPGKAILEKFLLEELEKNE